MTPHPDHPATQRTSHRSTRRAGVYPLVLVVAAAGAAAGLTGLAMRQAAADRQRTTGDLVRARLLARSGVESAAGVIAENDEWRKKFQDSGAWTLTMDGGEVSVLVSDPTDNDLTDEDTDPYAITATATAGGARAVLRATASIAPDLDYRDRVLAESPIAYWPLDEDEWTWPVADLMGLQFGGYSSPSVAGKEDGFDERPAPRFDSMSASAYVPHHDGMLLDDGTIFCHVWVDRDVLLANQTVFAKDIRGDNGTGSLRIYATDPGLTLRVRLENEDTTVDQAVGTLTRDEWAHVAVSFGRRGLAVCLNGQRVFTDSTMKTGLGTGAGGSGNTHTLTIGMWYDGDSFEDSLQGSVRDVVFFDRQLNHREIAEIVIPHEEVFVIGPDAWEWVVD